ncbi:MAG TPA: SUF system NifU family Fe-S cluster assembly protein [Gemmatimonadota bacterium]|nr:SUF system NifU family Fe-S cluster assembly protein [Gemmatimonadota bacterium]
MSDTEGGRGVDRSIPDSLSSLYQEVILDHYRRPRNKGDLEGATHTVTMNNPLCGDVIELQLRVKDDRIAEARFKGRGCSISQAAASMMTGSLEGRTTSEALALTVKFKELMHGEPERMEDADLGDLRTLAGVAKFPVRIKCALLGFNCLEEMLEEEDGNPGGR